jgi:hypothetical protein
MTPISNGMVRVKATRGFYAHHSGGLNVVNPGDVVDINANDAKMLRSADKAVFVQAETDPGIQKGWLPERKRDKNRGLSPVEKQLALQTEAVAGLTAAVTALQTLVQSLVEGQTAVDSGKKK